MTLKVLVLPLLLLIVATHFSILTIRFYSLFEMFFFLTIIISFLLAQTLYKRVEKQ